jgi:hypothetical protein
VLDLISITGKLISTSKDPEQAAMSTSWNVTLVADLALDIPTAESLACGLRYTADPDLPDGWLFIPSKMEQKWAIAFRGGSIYMLRSWTGEVKAAGRAARDGADLVVERIDLADDSLRAFGDPIQTFDWMIRTHALGQIAPLPVASEGAALLESAPLSVFSVFGHVAACAATGWWPPPQDRPLRSTGDITTALRADQAARVRQLAAAGASLDARSPVLGFTALHVAAVKGSVALAKLLLELGADPNVLADDDACALITAVVHRAPLEMLDLLARHGALATTVNADGFGIVHAIAENDHAEHLPWAVAHGLDLEARTRHGHTALHIAAALGHVATLRALLAAGAERAAKDPTGKTARDIALAEDKPASVEALDRGG